MKHSVAKALALTGVLAAAGAAVFFGSNADELGAPQVAAAAEQGEDDAEDELSAVEVFEAKRGSLSTYLSATANLEAEDSVAVVAEAAGRVTAVKANEGDEVSKGALLVSLDAKSARMSIRAAELRADQATAERERAAELARKSLVSREELEKLTTDGALAAQELEEAKYGLSQTRIRAPRSGRVTARKVTEGQYVRVGDELFDITDFEVLVARIHVPEREAMALAPGRAVDVELQADTSVELQGKVRAVSSVVDAASGTVKVTIEVHDPPPQVRSGSFVTVSMTREQVADAVWVPREAVVRGPRSAHLFVIDGDTATKREVELGIEERGKLQVRKGLEVGESVVLSGQTGLEDGARVKVLAKPE